MTLDDCIKRIQRYLQSDAMQPRFVNVENVSDLICLKTHFRVGRNAFWGISKYCAQDEMPNFDALIADISKHDGPVFLVELTTGAKYIGEETLHKLLDDLAYHSKLNCRTVVLCYQCADELNFQDKRLGELVYLVEGKRDPKPQIVLLPEEMPYLSDVRIVQGVHCIAEVIESGLDSEILYVRTRKSKAAFIKSLLSISEESDAYDALCKLDPRTLTLDRAYGSSDYWTEALKLVAAHGTWVQTTTVLFGNIMNLHSWISNWNTASTQMQWLHFIAMKLFDAGEHWCLQAAVSSAQKPDQVLKEVLRSLLRLDHQDNDYWHRYDQRKRLLDLLMPSEEDAADYCELTLVKGKNALYYLSSRTKVEKEYIIKTLDRYAIELGRDTVVAALEHVYPDLFAYLIPYRFEHELLNEYFQAYKFAKVFNRVFSDIEALVEGQAIKRDYNRLLRPRSELVESIPRENTVLYYVDALGVEFLSYIMVKCYEKKLLPKIQICRCALPSISIKNQEFLDGYPQNAVVSVKEIDDIKHQGKEGYDYRFTKMPLHLSRELEIIEEVLNQIQNTLRNNPGRRVFIVSDHGATRLAVIKENTLSVEVNSKGTHGGRVCEYTQEIEHLPQATEVDGYYVLANYDRFKGGRAASVETHGGATLEEVTIPIIEITAVPAELEILVLTPIIQVSSRKRAFVELFCKPRLEQISVSINGMYFDASTLDQRKFTIQLPEIRRPGEYLMDVYTHNTLICKGLSFVVEKEGFREKQLL